MKKKFIALLAVAAMSIAFVGCGDSEKSTTKATTETTTEATDDTTDTADASDNDTSADIQVERGVIDSGVFTNRLMKVSFPITEDMTVYTDEQVLSIMGMSQDLLTDENGVFTAEQYEDAMSGTIYDIMFAFPDGRSNVSVAYSNLNKNGMAPDISTDVYAAACVSQLEQMTSPKYDIAETTTETYGGLEYTCINAGTDQGFSQKMLMRREGNYMILITLTCLDSTPELATDFLNSFIPVQ